MAAPALGPKSKHNLLTHNGHPCITPPSAAGEAWALGAAQPHQLESKQRLSAQARLAGKGEAARQQHQVLLALLLLAQEKGFITEVFILSKFKPLGRATF